ncbi:ribonuclease Z [Paenibacillus phyllosphaerae]|uniref:Ribonuclease Z n=1 Tax=Paenibacillus phyllosphaerae TaxID=274593 RepID=A0A7W5AX02_9BACL|nr:ribonuclease Z [Paenibacillus phyllosphaerae]MBB3110359.1 ribonuclease Z [Paenibacillus phyllosphaerae]
MQLMFLGTSAGRPTKTRNVTAAALVLPDPLHVFWLFDAGEGTQHRMLGSKLKLNRLEKIFITHLHGDHIYGLPGLLSSRSYFEGAVPLELIGPPGIKAFIEGVFALSGTHLEYEFTIREVEPGLILENDRFKVTADTLVHRLPCYGYRIEEKESPGPLKLERLAEFGLKPGPEYGQLKRGEDVQLADGTWIRSSEVAGKPLKGRIVTILGDTSPCDAAIALAKDADLLVHEATFAPGMEEKAAAYGHSTSMQAAQIALEANVKTLVLTHFSSRLCAEDVEQLVQAAQTLIPDTRAAEDYSEIAITRPERG